MFVVLQVLPRESGFFSALRERLNPPEPEIEKIAVKNGAPFFILKVKRTRDGIPWEDVLYAAGRCAQRLVMTSDDVPPVSLPIHSFEPQLLPFRLLLNTVIGFLTDSERTKTQLGIIDRNAELCDELDRAVKVSAVVRVVTRDVCKYEKKALEVFTQCGAPVMVSDDASLLSGCNIIVSRTLQEACTLRGRIFSLDAHDAEQRNITLPPEYESIRPRGVKALTFACALYELCGVKSLGELKYD